MSLQTLLKLVEPITARNSNRLWELNFISRYSSPEIGKPKDIEALISYFSASQAHKEMIQRYWPVSEMTPEEKIKKTANTV
jgi:hypothetical protein